MMADVYKRTQYTPHDAIDEFENIDDNNTSIVCQVWITDVPTNTTTGTGVPVERTTFSDLLYALDRRQIKVECVERERYVAFDECWNENWWLNTTPVEEAS
jgi:hypothetical protein